MILWFVFVDEGGVVRGWRVLHGDYDFFLIIKIRLEIKIK